MATCDDSDPSLTELEQRGYSPSPFYRIYVGKTAQPDPTPLWLRFTFNKHGEVHDVIYTQAEFSYIRSLSLLGIIDHATIPGRFKPPTGKKTADYKWLVEAAWEFAQKQFGDRARTPLDDTGQYRRYLARKKKQHTGESSEESDDSPPKKKQKPKLSANGTDVASQVATDPDADLDDAAVERVWLDFKVPCSEIVTDRMGAILFKRHKLQQKPPSTLLYDLRLRGKLLNPEDPWAVLNCRIWKNWQADQLGNGEGSSAHAANTTGAGNDKNTTGEHQDDFSFLDEVD